MKRSMQVRGARSRRARGGRQFEKREEARALRRLAKRDPERAPLRLPRLGWVS